MSPRQRRFMLFLLGLALPGLGSTCSAFFMDRNAEAMLAKNLDWDDPLPGLVFVNQPGVTKSILPWQGYGPREKEYEAVGWTSRYGSISFSCYGRDFVAGGMNEAGLIVEEANLTSSYGSDDGRPGISSAQWIQLQLDLHSTVEELISHLGDLRHDGEGWHFIVGDREGDCAVIEFVNGVTNLYEGENLPYGIITNAPYESALSHLPLDQAFGGDLDIGTGKDSYGRFVRIAAMLEDAGSPSIESAFEILEAVADQSTRRSIVYDAISGRIEWRTGRRAEAPYLSFEDLLFEPGAPTLMLDIETGSGNVAPLLLEYEEGANRRIVDLCFPIGPFPTRDIEQARERIARHSRKSNFDMSQ